MRTADNTHSESVYIHEKYRNIPYIIISGPSAGGKTTLASKAACEFDKMLMLLIKHTDRLPRNGEIDGKDYYFLRAEAFDSKITYKNALVKVTRYDHKYALCSSEVDLSIVQNRRPMFILDPHAALKFKEHYCNSVLFFVAPFLLSTVEDRINSRKEENVEKEKRLVLLKEEFELRHLFDYNVFNDEGIDIIRKIIIR